MDKLEVTQQSFFVGVIRDYLERNVIVDSLIILSKFNHQVTLRYWMELGSVILPVIMSSSICQFNSEMLSFCASTENNWLTDVSFKHYERNSFSIATDTSYRAIFVTSWEFSYST